MELYRARSRQGCTCVWAGAWRDATIGPPEIERAGARFTRLVLEICGPPSPRLACLRPRPPPPQGPAHTVDGDGCMEQPERVSLPEGFEDVDVDFLVQLVGAQPIRRGLSDFPPISSNTSPHFVPHSGHDGTARRPQRQNTSFSVRTNPVFQVAMFHAYSRAALHSQSAQRRPHPLPLPLSSGNHYPRVPPPHCAVH